MEKIADKLGLNPEKDVVCVSCKETIKLKNAIVLSSNDVHEFICQDCFAIIRAGTVKERKNIIGEMEKFLEEERNKNIQTLPYRPNPPMLPTEPYIGDPYLPFQTWKTGNNQSIRTIINEDWELTNYGTGESIGFLNYSTGNLEASKTL